MKSAWLSRVSKAVLAVISDGLSISQVAGGKVGCRGRRCMRGLARYEAEGLEGSRIRSHRPELSASDAGTCRGGGVGVAAVAWPYWGPRRLVFELARSADSAGALESAVYRALVRAAMIDPAAQDRRSRKVKRWERSVAMELWQMDVVGGFRWRTGLGEGVDRG